MSGNNLFLEQRLTEIDQWLDMLHSQRYVSPHTLAAYRRDVERLAFFLAKEQCEDWAELDQARLTAFIGPLLSTNSLLPISVQRMLSALRGFYDWLGAQGKVSHNPAKAFKIKRQRRSCSARSGCSKVVISSFIFIT